MTWSFASTNGRATVKHCCLDQLGLNSGLARSTLVYVFARFLAPPAALLYLVAIAFGGWSVWRIPTPVRSRMMVIAFPIIAVMFVAADRYSTTVLDAQLGDPRHLESDRLVMLAVAPVLTFVVGVALLRRREQILHLLALGRITDRPEWTSAGPTSSPGQ